ncbi:hypothetical protein BRD17_01825 [Halobacteriales archaeon SW_7_68_16]|nr:MAG: hypothetical protein BRD17_01825 [Halobacteriales archaeon SW_7_68_16]
MQLKTPNVAFLVGAGIVTVCGAVFGTACERTGSLIVSMLSHAAYNLVLLGVTYVSL